MVTNNELELWYMCHQRLISKTFKKNKLNCVISINDTRISIAQTI